MASAKMKMHDAGLDDQDLSEMAARIDGRLVARFDGCENTIDEGLTSTFRSNRLPLEVSS